MQSKAVYVAPFMWAVACAADPDGPGTGPGGASSLASTVPTSSSGSASSANLGGASTGLTTTDATSSGELGPSCAGYCGWHVATTCYCDEGCEQLGDCCFDFFQACIADFSFTALPSSCEKDCGHQAAGGCHCDDECNVYGDCCGDYKDTCPKAPASDWSIGQFQWSNPRPNGYFFTALWGHSKDGIWGAGPDGRIERYDGTQWKNSGAPRIGGYPDWIGGTSNGSDVYVLSRLEHEYRELSHFNGAIWENIPLVQKAGEGRFRPFDLFIVNDELWASGGVAVGSDAPQKGVARWSGSQWVFTALNSLGSAVDTFRCAADSVGLSCVLAPSGEVARLSNGTWTLSVPNPFFASDQWNLIARDNEKDLILTTGNNPQFSLFDGSSWTLLGAPDTAQSSIDDFRFWKGNPVCLIDGVIWIWQGTWSKIADVPTSILLSHAGETLLAFRTWSSGAVFQIDSTDGQPATVETSAIRKVEGSVETHSAIGSAPNHTFAVGPGGILMRNVAESDWVSQPVSIRDWSDVYVADDSHAWVAASGSNVLATWDGLDWKEEALQLSTTLGIHGHGNHNVWAVGFNDGAPVATRWDGFTWSVESLPSECVPERVQVLSDTSVWTFNATSLCHRNGDSWQSYSVSKPSQIAVESDTKVWMLRLQEDGTSAMSLWSPPDPMTGPSRELPYELPADLPLGIRWSRSFVAGPGKVWFVGSDRAMYWNGVSWLSVRVPLSSENFDQLTGLWADADNHAWIVRGATILEHVPVAGGSP